MAGPSQLVGADFFQACLDQVRKLEVFEKQIEKFIPAQHELERVLRFATVRAMFAIPAATCSFRLRELVADHEFLVAVKDSVVLALRQIGPEFRLVDASGRDRHCFAGCRVGDPSFRDTFVDDFLDPRPRTPQEALAVAEARLLRVLATIYEMMHDMRPTSVSQPCSPACTIPRADEPAVLYIRARSSAARNPRASAPCRCLSWYRS